MAVTEVLGGLGSWEINLSDETPDEVLKNLTFFGHVAIFDGGVEVDEANSTLMLQRARYVGVLRQRGRSRISGAGMAFWLGDEEGIGPILASVNNKYDANTLDFVVTQALTSTTAVVAGTIHPQVDSAARYTGDRRWETIREAFDLALPTFDAEYRVNGDATLDVGTGAQLYGSSPTAIIVRNGGGRDFEFTGIGGEFDTDQDVLGWATGVTMLGQTKGDRTIPRRAADATGVPYSDPQGQPLRLTKLIDVPSVPEGTLQQHTDKELARTYRARRAVTIDLAEWETDVEARCGEYVYVYDPQTGLVDTANEVFFRGQVLHPAIERVSEATWSVREGMTVAFRTHTGVWLDLTPFVTWETGADTLVVGEVPASLLTRTTPAKSVKAREDAQIPGGTVNGVAPNPPTALTLDTSSTLDASGQNAAVIHATWTPPTTNTDGSTLTDLASFTVQWRWTGRPDSWEKTSTTEPAADLPAAAGLPYVVRVAAIDSDGQVSAWSAAVAITTADDTVAPPVPSAPTVTSYLGQLRIEWDGLGSSGEGMPADFNRVDVHVSATSGFTPSTTTLVDSLSTKGVSYATAPYGSVRYVKLIAYDHHGNASAASAEASGSTSQVVSADVFDGAIGSAKLADLAVITAKINDLAVNDAKIGNVNVGKLVAGTMTADVTVSGRFATALTGARREMNALGFQAWDSSENLTIDLDGTDNLITGKFRSGMPGTRHVEIDNAADSGAVRLYAADGKYSQFRGFMDVEGREAMQVGVPRTDLTSDGYYNRLTINYDGKAHLKANQAHVIYTRDSTALGVGTGYFSVQQSGAEGSTGTGVIEMQRIEQGATVFVQPATGAEFRYHERVVNGDGTVTNWQKLLITNDAFWFRFHRLGRGDAKIEWGHDDGAASPKLVLTASGGQGARLRAGWTSANGSRMEVRNVADSGYEAIWASAFTVSSLRELKRDITDFTAARDLAQRVRVRRYIRTGEGPGQVDVPEIGLIAQEAPPELLTPEGDAVNLYSLAALALATAQAALARTTPLGGL